MTTPAVREVNIFHSPHLWVSLVWGCALILYVFAQPATTGYEIRYAAERTGEKFFPYGNCSAVATQDSTDNKRPLITSVVQTQKSLLDINRASAKELIAIKGIGEVLAGRIIAERERLSSFTAMKQLLNVKGIGEKKLAQLKSQAEVKK